MEVMVGFIYLNIIYFMYVFQNLAILDDLIKQSEASLQKCFVTTTHNSADQFSIKISSFLYHVFFRWVTLKNNLFLGQNKTVIICALIKPEESKNQMKIVNDATVVVKGEGIGQLLPLSLSVEKDSSMVPANFHFTQEKQEDGKITVSMRLSEGKDLSVFGVAFVLNTGTLVHVSQTYFVVFLPLLVSLLSRFVI